LRQVQSTGSWDLTGGGNSVVERELSEKKL
jgi:hypothetical protein